MDVAIRKAVVGDAESVARIYVASWNAGFGGLLPERQITAELTKLWGEELDKPAMTWRVAEVAGRERSGSDAATAEVEIAGFAGTGPSRDPVDDQLGELDTIAVDPRWWRHGVGSALMSAALDDLARAGFGEAVLWTLADYPRGQDFYASWGWHKTGQERDSGRQLCYRRRLG